MRTIKFRIYDKQKKQFIYKLPEKHHLEWERFDVQQFTGLTDKQGKEIYEGDVVKTFIGNCRCDFLPTGIWFGGLDLVTAGKDIEVIGNIYENKDLIK